VYCEIVAYCKSILLKMGYFGHSELVLYLKAQINVPQLSFIKKRLGIMR
jgi:hypothetical protein